MIRAAAFLAVVASPAFGHEWYDPECCSGRDCAPISREHVTIEAEGYRVQLQPGDHPLVTRPVDRVVPYGSRPHRNSPDGEFHACILGGWLLQCLYAPPEGF